MKNYLLLILCAIFFVRCYKEDTAVKYDQNPIKLNVEDSFKGTKLTWTTLPSNTEFVSYRVYRSVNNDTINEKNLSVNAFVVFSSTDSEIGSFFDNNQGFGTVQSKIYYRVEAAFKNRSIWSKNVLLVENAKSLNESFSSIFTDKETSKLYLYNSTNSVIKIFDLVQEKLMDAKLNFATNDLIESIAFGTFNGQREMYAIRGKSLGIYDANTFELIKTIDLQRIATSLIVGKNNILYISLSDNVYDVLIFDRNTETKTLHAQVGNSTNLILMYLPIKNRLVALKPNFSQAYLTYFDLSADGKNIIASTPKIILGTKFSNINNLSQINYLSDNETFIIGNQISFFDKDFKFLNSAPQDFNGDYDSFTVTNEDKVIAARFNDRSIRQFNSKGIVTNQLVTKNFPREIINIKDKSWIIYGNSAGSLFIEKFGF